MVNSNITTSREDRMVPTSNFKGIETASANAKKYYNFCFRCFKSAATFLIQPILKRSTYCCEVLFPSFNNLFRKCSSHEGLKSYINLKNWFSEINFLRFFISHINVHNELSKSVYVFTKDLIVK